MTAASLRAIRPGPSVTIQDLGRRGLGRHGIAAGGVLDDVAHHLGAALLGQSPELASLEIAAFGGTFEVVGAPMLVAVTGATGPAYAGGAWLPHSEAVLVRPGTTIDLGPTSDATYSYLSASGGFATTPEFGSRSTHVRAGFGGLAGTVVVAGDHIPVGESIVRAPSHRAARLPANHRPIRVVAGMHADTVDDLEATLAAPYTVSDRRDRMGVGLTPQDLVPTAVGLPSAPVVAGDIQIPGDGHPVVLLADCQPTGGYPRLATVITADLGRFAQLPTGSSVEFELVTVADAVEALRAHRALLASLPDVLTAADDGQLLEHNLISGFTVGDQED